jgi:hypothetical protein
MSLHDEHDDTELTPELRAALAALPREREPGRLLEERTVRALRERGVVQPQGTRRVRFPAAWISGAAAAALALFVSGLAVGQYVGAKSTERVVAEVQRQNAQAAALLVQQTGSAYVSALSQFASLAAAGDTAGARQGREAAVGVLRAAADELVRIAPDDPVASGILAGFDQSRTRQQQARGDTTGKERVVWF